MFKDAIVICLFGRRPVASKMADENVRKLLATWGLESLVDHFAGTLFHTFNCVHELSLWFLVGYGLNWIVA